MAYQQVPNTAQITVVYSLTGQTLVNTYHAEKAGGYLQADLNALAAAIDTNCVPQMLLHQASNLVYVRTDVRGLDQENDLTASNNTNSGTGQVFNTVLPANLSFCVQKLSGLTGRSARGRVFICGIPINYLSTTSGEQSQISVTGANNYKADVERFKDQINLVSGWQAVIVSRYSEGQKRTPAITFNWTATAYADRVFDTMRLRRPI